ncbi:7alpha-cephem-methoxylase p8 chain related [Fusarium sporotrichioides]|uniref:7alpha-cephem-methoxylase p8 chain related n=1 Tax=Fusarium sporotrichioides TaxID=5514 RepID=A0A395RUM1_FUSSP|nr:7alpha-cephem-methoxylase p8 chain related [Fusarium sporotrichioides]
MSGVIPVPHGDVTAALSFYRPPVDGSDPHFIFSREKGQKPKFNFSDHVVDVTIRDIRQCKEEFTLDSDAFQIITDAPPPSTAVDFLNDQSITKLYYPEITRFLSESLKGDVHIFPYDHTVRLEEKGAQHGPLTRVHVDHTANNAIRRIKTYFPEEAEYLLQGRYRIINVWRPLNEQPLESFPLAFASASTFDDNDLVPVEHRFEDGELVREVGLIKHSSSQIWYYLSGMTDKERILLKCFDSESLKHGAAVACKTPHTAFRDPRTRQGSEGRFSVEVRCLVFGG